MRQIILDTETTGLNARLGDRIIEVGCIEMVNRRFTGNNWHRYVNPEKSIEEGAKAVHGISEEFLADKPKFADIASEFLDYIRGAELIIHNAAFDIEFLDAEFARLDMGKVSDHSVTVADTLKLARELHPGKRNSLDALCDRYQVNNQHRTLHGALLDAELLAEVYLAMTRGQDSLAIGFTAGPETTHTEALAVVSTAPASNIKLVVLAASAEESAAHEKLLAGIARESGGKCVWLAAEPHAEAA
jgi:DNA polymerase-3 subunit epsilon